MLWVTVSLPSRPLSVIVAVAGANASLAPKSSVPTEPLSGMSWPRRMIAMSGLPTRLWRYATRSWAPSGTAVSWNVVERNVKTVVDLPPSEIVGWSVSTAFATLPLMVLPVAGGGHGTSVCAANSAWVMYCTVIADASLALSTTHATLPRQLRMVKLKTSPVPVMRVQGPTPSWAASQAARSPAGQPEKSTVTLPEPLVPTVRVSAVERGPALLVPLIVKL